MSCFFVIGRGCEEGRAAQNTAEAAKKAAEAAKKAAAELHP